MATWIENRKLTTLTRLVILIALYFVGGLIGKETTFLSGSVALVWPPAGIALAAILLRQTTQVSLKDALGFKKKTLFQKPDFAPRRAGANCIREFITAPRTKMCCDALLTKSRKLFVLPVELPTSRRAP